MQTGFCNKSKSVKRRKSSVKSLFQKVKRTGDTECSTMCVFGGIFILCGMYFIICIHLGGGPPLHIHPTEEAHVVLTGRVTYYIDDSVFTEDAPFSVRIPPNTLHAFINSGDTILNLPAAFGQDNFGPYRPIGTNPLIK